MSDRAPLDGGFLGGSAGCRAFSRFCAVPVKTETGDFAGILFGPEDALSAEDRQTVVDRAIDERVHPRGGKPSRVFYGWAVKYSVNPTVATLQGTVPGSGSWGSVSAMFPTFDPKDLFRLLMNYGYRFNRASDDASLRGGSGLDAAKNGSFDILFYACDFGSPLSS